MADLATALAELANATTVQAVQDIASSVSAAAINPGTGGVLYSGMVGTVSAHSVAISISQQSGLNIIDNTIRGQFLSSSAVESTLQNILMAAHPNATAAEIQQLVKAALFEGSSSLWGQASAAFVSSLIHWLYLIQFLISRNLGAGRKFSDGL